ncbi:EF-hand calcium-binding domain-containing protein 1-like isoform X2 [Oryx dammah]|uniref:EF-hand calcium-binding domain-containing protein 1-like isoform X2 n=1 Tax=Oryx dammah TaxID=59534 RepID=UPI001A9B3868|nr:EF-hand calcium-binding domain-containing protein 1-like isoform X2 [Oryx dammah]
MDQKVLKRLVESISKSVNLFFAFDKDNDNYINVKEWVKGLSVFLRGTFEEKLKFCFEVYYFNGDGYISRERIYDMLKNSLHQQSPGEETDEGIRELVDIALKKMDYDNDGRISFADFEKAVKEDRLLLEVFGPCLPDAKSIRQEILRIGREEKRDTIWYGPLLLISKKEKRETAWTYLDFQLCGPLTGKKMWEAVVKVYQLQILICFCLR